MPETETRIAHLGFNVASGGHPEDAMRQTRLITVFGGTGFLGSRVVARLLASGQRVRIAARHPEKRPDLLQGDKAEACHADLFDSDSLHAALEGVDGAVNATSLYVEHSGLTYQSVHVEAAARLASIAKRAGIRSFVQLSGIGADPEAPDSYIRARGQGETAVLAANSAARLVRPAVMFGADDAFLVPIQVILRRAPFFPLFGSGRTRLQPVWVEDVADAIIRLLDPDAAPTIYELAGADIVTYRELVELLASQSGTHARAVPVSFAVWQPLATIAERMPGAPLTKAQIALMQIDNVATESTPGFSSLGIAPRGVVGYVCDWCREQE